MKENCAECKHHDVFWGSSGCNLLNNEDSCKFEPKVMTNADRIREMSDEELNEMFHEIYNAGEEDAVAYEWGQRTNSFEWTMDWLQQPAEEG